ncbi:MAG TPA: cytochrome c1 [Steroidobacteraceae bacterium]|jgi:ubiquinol-cytochrome c reductase cytochrome c1 subunit|nr:cytochrome c1 [Steroidobacteraceae bacterium]
MLKRCLFVAAAILASSVAPAQEGGIALEPSGTNIRNLDSLQRGARNFMNYCSGCHSLKYVRYNRLAADLKIPESELGNLMFTTDKSSEGVNSAMPKDAEAWFGKQPPDLSLMCRARGVDYCYSFLRGFYVDTARPWGVNNLYLPSAAMPDVLASLQGLQKAVYKNEKDERGDDHMVLAGVALMSPGTMKPEEFDQFVRDLANFLDYAAEPIKAKRESLGIFVTLFLLVFFVFAYLLKKEYWKDVH